LTIKYKTYEKFGNILVENVLDKLTGMHTDFERIGFHEPPSNNILIGTLGGVNLTQDIDNDSIFPNSLSVKFLLNDFSSEISVDIEFYLYYRVYPTYEEQLEYSKKNKSEKMRFQRIWKRKKVEANVVFDKNTKILSLSNNILNSVEEIKEDLDLLREDTSFVKEEVLSSEDVYEKFLSKEKRKKLPDLSWEANLIFNNRNFVQNNQNRVLVEIDLVNVTPLHDTTDKTQPILFDSSLFNPSLKIYLGENNFKKFNYLYPESKDEYYEADLRCLNCQGKFYPDSNSIITQNFGRYKQEKIIPKNSLDDVDLSFEILSTEQGLIELEKIYLLMNDFYNQSSADDPKREDFNLMKERFNENISLLKTNSDVAKAFYLMNETFRRNSEDSSYHTWRLFQIVFIVSQLKDIALDEERETCELLHVMTGGGKSETYFGIVVFTAFFDRISGKEFGISAVTKFPLRMLSVQQLQRISNIFIFAEEVRKDASIEGHPFSIAYFVGSQDSDFPSHNINFLTKIRKAKDENEKIKGQIIDKCPLCRGNVYLSIDESRELVLHECDSCGKEFRLFFSDDEIYRTLPTFIISTVDKWAGIALNRRFRNLLGGKLDICPNEHGFIPRNDTCGFHENLNGKECKQSGTPIEKDFNTAPTLIIQDEMHLIREGFGTIDSHFETLMETMKVELSSGPKFKNIVMTATVSGAAKQIQHLYHKSTRIFPPSLEDQDGNTFFFYTSKEDDEDIFQREIIGLKSSIQNFKLVFHVLKYTSQFFKDLEADFDTFASHNGFDVEELKTVSSYYKKLLTYHNKKEAVHSVSYSVDDYVNIYDDVYKVQTEPLTGERTLDDIKNIIYKVEHFYDDENNKDKMFVVNSTNIVSHGVDIDEWNFMLFDGMPRSTSEYIQALSRVGRKYFGIVFVSFSPMRTRDLSFYQHFNEYHKMLNDRVENVPLSRWAKLGFKQTFTSVFNAAILNYLSDELERPLFRTSSVINVLRDEDNLNKLIEFIKKAYISDSTMMGSKYFDEKISYEVDRRINQMFDFADVKFFPNALKRGPDKYFRTQHGMRGIQDEILLSPHDSDDYFRSIYKGE